jgi:lysophospholipase L1-like esterase
MMVEPELTMVLFVAPKSWRTAARLAVLVIVGVSGYVAIELLPSWLPLWQPTHARWLRRRVAIAFLDGLAIVYSPVFVAAFVTATVLALGRSRGPLSPPRARVLLLSTSVVLSLLALEAGAAVWHAWLHRSPILPSARPTESTIAADADRSRDLTTGAAPDLTNRLSSAKSGIAAGALPLRILVIGESSARGEPYHPWLSVGQIVAWRLETVFPGRPIHVDTWAEGGATLETMHKKLATLRDRPDVIIVYVGHNEIQARYSWMRDVDYYVDTDLPRRVPLNGLFAVFPRISPFCSLIQETRDRQQTDVLPPRAVTRELVDRPVCSQTETARILADFHRRLESIAHYCETMATLAVFVIPPSNDAGFDPSRSILARETTRSQRVTFSRAVTHARFMESRDRSMAIRLYRELIETHPEFAETHFRLATLLEQTACWDEAQHHYTLAREADALPLRCPEPFRQAYRETAERHPGLLLIDGPRLFEAKSPHGIVDDYFFHDAQHPNLQGYAILAEELLAQLGARRAFGWPESTPVPYVDLEGCARHFQLDAARWDTICQRSGAFFRITAYVRYDPKFRNERATDYEQAAAAIRAGANPADAEIPGWPMPPKPPPGHLIPTASIR